MGKKLFKFYAELFYLSKPVNTIKRTSVIFFLGRNQLITGLFYDFPHLKILININVNSN